MPKPRGSSRNPSVKLAVMALAKIHPLHRPDMDFNACHATAQLFWNATTIGGIQISTEKARIRVFRETFDVTQIDRKEGCLEISVDSEEHETPLWIFRCEVPA